MIRQTKELYSFWGKLFGFLNHTTYETSIITFCYDGTALCGRMFK